MPICIDEVGRTTIGKKPKTKPKVEYEGVLDEEPIECEFRGRDARNGSIKEKTIISRR